MAHSGPIFSAIRGAAIPVLLSILPGGCRNSEPDDLPRSDGSDVQLALCETFVRCSQQWGPSFSEVSECVRVTSRCNPNASSELFLSGTEAHLADCAAEIRDIECNDFPQISLRPFQDYASLPAEAAGHQPGAFHELIEVAPACDELAPLPASGKLAAVGESCRGKWCGEFDTECRSEDGYICVRDHSEGQDCDWEEESNICGLDLYCETTDEGDICRRRTSFATLLEGEDCSTGIATCRGALRCLDGICTRLLLNDAPCDDSNQCALDLACLEGSCQPFDYCSASAGLDEPCYRASRCGEGFYCDTDTLRGDTRSLCHAYLQPGQACTFEDGDPNARRCSPGHGCIMGTCAPTDLPPGESCLTNSQCQSYLCQEGLCLPEDLPGGASCSESRQCDSFVCEEGKCLFDDLENGQACELSVQCKSLACREGVCAAD